MTITGIWAFVVAVLAIIGGIVAATTLFTGLRALLDSIDNRAEFQARRRLVRILGVALVGEVNQAETVRKLQIAARQYAMNDNIDAAIQRMVIEFDKQAAPEAGR